MTVVAKVLKEARRRQARKTERADQGGGGRVHIRAGQVFYASFLSQDGRRSSRSPSPQGRTPEYSNELSGKIGNFLFFNMWMRAGASYFYF